MRKVLCTHRLLQDGHFNKISFLLQPHYIKGVSCICVKFCIHCLNSNHHFYDRLKDDFFVRTAILIEKLYVVMTHSLTNIHQQVMFQYNAVPSTELLYSVSSAVDINKNKKEHQHQRKTNISGGS